MVKIITLAGKGDTSAAANALRLGFVAAARSAGLDRTQTIGAWSDFQQRAAPAGVDEMFDALLASFAAAPPVAPVDG